MQKVRPITVKLPAKAYIALEKIADAEFITVQGFVQQRLSDLICQVRSMEEAEATDMAETDLGMYL